MSTIAWSPRQCIEHLNIYARMGVRTIASGAPDGIRWGSSAV
jgi:hypothetical protein